MPRKPLVEGNDGQRVELQEYMLPDIPQVDRSAQIREYFNRLQTDAEKIDFLSQMGLLSLNRDGNYLTPQESNVVADLTTEFFQPTKVNANGNRVLDTDLEKKRLKDFYKHQMQLNIEVGEEYQRILNSLPEDDPLREQKAAYQVSNGETAQRCMNNASFMLASAEMQYSGDYMELRNEAKNEFEEAIEDDDDQKERLQIGAEITSKDSPRLAAAHYSKFGLTEEEDYQNRLAPQKSLLKKVDLNWTDDRTMYNRPTFLDPATETEARLHYNSTYSDMPRKPGVSGFPDRSEELREYSRKMNTPAKRVDFFTQMNVLEVLGQAHGRVSLLSNQEQNVMSEYANAFRNPAKRNERGELVLDEEKLHQNLKEMHKAQFRLHMEVGKEYFKTLDSLPLNDPNREKKAGFLTQNSEPAILAGLNGMNMVRSAQFEHKDESKNAELEALEEFKSTLSAEELKVFEQGQDLCAIESKLLKGATPESVGLNKTEMEQIERRTAHSLISKADMNWAKNETMNNRPTFYDQQIETDTQKRNARYYLTLDEEGKKQFIANGLMQGMLDDNNTAYTRKEQEAFRECFNHYFKPVTPDGKLDYDTFEKRIDGIADLVADGYCKAGQQIRTANLDELMGDYAKDEGTRQYVVGLTNKDYVKAHSAEYILKDLVFQGAIDKRLVDNYVERKQNADPRAEIADFDDAFNYRRTEAAYTLPDGKKNYDAMSKSQPPYPGAKEELFDKLNPIAEETKKKALADIRSDKKWDSPENNINLDSLRKLSNLYEQLKGEDHWYHYNSSEYEKLRDTLKIAHDKYQQVKNRSEELSPVEKAKLVSVYDDIANKAINYLSTDNKETKKRGTDLGQNRYEQAFAALNVTSSGMAKNILYSHTIYRNLSGKREVTLQDLEDRANRTRDEQKAHEEQVKRAPKNRNRQIEPPQIQAPHA